MFKRVILLLIKLYQHTFSPDHGIFRRAHKGCRFYPTCSDYAYQAVEKYGAMKGILFALKRVSRCHPWNAGGYDPVESHNT